MLSLSGKCLNLLLLLDFLKSLGLLDLHQLLVCFGKVGAHLSDLLLTGNFTLFFTFEVLLSLAFDELTLEHLLFKLLDEVEFEVFKLLADVLSIGLLKFVFLFQLCAHLLIVLGHFLLLDVHPVALNLSLHLLLTLVHLLLGLLLVSYITHEHFTFEGLDHVLLLMHSFVSLIDLLAT